MLIKLFVVLKLLFLIVMLLREFCKFLIVFLNCVLLSVTVICYEQTAARMKVIGSLK